MSRFPGTGISFGAQVGCPNCGSLTKGVHAAYCKSNPYLTFAHERGLDYGVVLRASETLRHNWPQQLSPLSNSDLQALKVVDRVEAERRQQVKADG